VLGCAWVRLRRGTGDTLLLIRYCVASQVVKLGGAMNNDVTRILNAIEQGDPNAAGELLPLVYGELRRLAARKMSRESPGQTLQPTALVHEAFLRLVGDKNSPEWDSRGHFFAAAAEAMRRILIENARRKKSSKRGGDMARCELKEHDAALDADDFDTLLALDEALTRLGFIDAQLARLVELRYFAGLTIEETAQLLNVSPRTIKRNWAYARAWLRREIDGAQ
jgi:RNA polymerase sigma factor (TIGR02999 family)